MEEELAKRRVAEAGARSRLEEKHAKHLAANERLEALQRRLDDQRAASWSLPGLPIERLLELQSETLKNIKVTRVNEVASFYNNK